MQQMALQPGSHVVACARPCQPTAGGVAGPAMAEQAPRRRKGWGATGDLQAPLAAHGVNSTLVWQGVGHPCAILLLALPRVSTAKGTSGCCVLIADGRRLFLPFQKGTDACGG